MDEIYKQVFELWKHSPNFDDTVRKDGKNPVEVRVVKLESVAQRDEALIPLIKRFWSGKGVRALTCMKWAFLVAPSDRCFFTSDDPFCCWARSDKRGPFGTVGTANEGVEITFPLSRKICAFGSWKLPPPQCYYQLPANKVDEINIRTVENAWRFVYGPTNDAKIMSLIKQIAQAEKKSQA